MLGRDGYGCRVETCVQRPLRAEDLRDVEAWFDDPETQRWLGGREWPRRLLDLAAAPDRFALLFTQHGDPVALLDLERNDDDTAAIACVVAPTHRRQGIAHTILHSLFALPEAKDLVEVVGEVEDGNVASQQLLRSGGFEFAVRTDEGFDRYVLRRHQDKRRLRQRPLA
jgi:RimJ/RimL family protein N-acetyltransferase